MDLTVPRKDILHLLDKCLPAADPKGAMPALANVLLEAKGTTLRCATTDLYRSVDGSLASVEVSTAGAIAVPVKDLFERVKVMPDGPLHLLANESCMLTLKAVGMPRRFTLHGIPGGEFPQIPKPGPDAWKVDLPASLLDGALSRVFDVVSLDETRPHVNSALFEWGEANLRLAATDGHRLCHTDVPLGKAASKPPAPSMLVPRDGLDTLRKLLGAGIAAAKGDKERQGPLTVSMHAHGPNAFLDVAGVRFAVKLVDAQFPPYMQVVPAKPAHSVRAERARLLSVVNAADCASDSKTNRIDLTFASMMLRVASKSPEAGEAYDEMPVDYTGPQVTICFNAVYVRKMLESLVADEVLLSFDGDLEPITVRPCDDTPFVGVIMPMRGS